MAFEDDFGSDFYEDDLQNLSDREAWEDSQADLAEARETHAHEELKGLARKAIGLQLELVATMAQLRAWLPEGADSDLAKDLEFTCAGLSGPEGITDEVVMVFLALVQEEP